MGEPTPNQSVPPPSPQGQGGEPRTYEVKADGKTLRVTEEELVKSFELTSAANRRMEDAAKLRKEAEAEIALAQNVKKFLGGDKDALRAVAESAGVPAENVDELIQNVNQYMGGATGQNGTEPAGSLGLELADFSPEVQQIFGKLLKVTERFEQLENSAAEQGIYGECEKRVDNDAILGKIKDDELRASAREFVRNEIQRQVGLHKRPWRDALEETVQKARTIFGRVANQAVPRPGQPFTGVGPAAMMSAAPVATEPVKPVSTRDPGYAKNLQQRLLQLLRSAGQ